MTGFGSTSVARIRAIASCFWDRLPMTLCFMGTFTAVVEEHVNAKAGAHANKQGAGSKRIDLKPGARRGSRRMPSVLYFRRSRLW